MEVKIIKKFTVCFSGHRKIPTELKEAVEHKLEETITGLISKGYIYFYTGGALGFDTMAAETVLKLRSIYPQIQLYLALPCITQSAKWSESEIKKYEQIKTLANRVIYVSQEYTEDCMFRRNRFLADNSSVCVCYLTKKRSGTAYTINYAKSQKVQIINIAQPNSSYTLF